MIGTHTLSRLSRATAVAMFVVALTAPGALAGSKCSELPLAQLLHQRGRQHSVRHRQARPRRRHGRDARLPVHQRHACPRWRCRYSTPVAHGFDWADAGIGAAGTAGLMLLLLGGTRLL